MSGKTQDGGRDASGNILADIRVQGPGFDERIILRNCHIQLENIMGQDFSSIMHGVRSGHPTGEMVITIKGLRTK